jgi:hypothetical protein
MRRTLMTAALLGAIGTAPPLLAQAVTANAVPTVAGNLRLMQAMREQLSVGYAPQRQPTWLLQQQGPDRPLVRQLVTVPDNPAAPPPLAESRQCPMPVVSVDPKGLAPMPVARADTAKLERMLVARSSCVNPLAR